MPDFTKGEWRPCKKYGFPEIIDESCRSIAHLNAIYFTREEAKANARLIAEAPVMYELLNKAFHILGKNTANDEIYREIDECLSRVDGAPVQTEKGEYR